MFAARAKRLLLRFFYSCFLGAHRKILLQEPASEAGQKNKCGPAGPIAAFARQSTEARSAVVRSANPNARLDWVAAGGGRGRFGGVRGGGGGGGGGGVSTISRNVCDRDLS